MNQYSQLFLKKMSNSKKIPSSLKHQQILKQLTKICKILHMNELEIATWSLIADKLEWKIEDLSLDDFIFVIGIQAKSLMISDEEMRIYYRKINDDFKTTKSQLDNWLKDPAHIFGFDIIDINKRYRKYRQVFFPQFNKLKNSLMYKQLQRDLGMSIIIKV